MARRRATIMPVTPASRPGDIVTENGIQYRLSYHNGHPTRTPLTQAPGAGYQFVPGFAGKGANAQGWMDPNTYGEIQSQENAAADKAGTLGAGFKGFLPYIAAAAAIASGAGALGALGGGSAGAGAADLAGSTAADIGGGITGFSTAVPASEAAAAASGLGDLSASGLYGALGAGAAGAGATAATTGSAAMGDGLDLSSLGFSPSDSGLYSYLTDPSVPTLDGSGLSATDLYGGMTGFSPYDASTGLFSDGSGMGGSGLNASDLSKLSQFMQQNPALGKLIGGIGGPVLNRLMNGGNNNQGPAPYQMQHQGAADNMLWDTANQQANQSNQYYGATLPESQAALQEQLNNPYAHSYIDNSAAAGAMAGRAAGQMEQGGNNLMGQGQQLYGEGQQALGAGQQVFNTAMDPQQALYNRTLHQTLDQTRAGLEARGLDMSGAGAGIEAQALDNFNMDWQNNQLGRQVQGMQALNQGYGDAIQGGNAYGRDAAAAGALYGQGQQFQQAAGQLPYAAQGQVGQDQQTAIANYENSLNPYFAGMQQNVNNMDAYLGRGQANQTNAFNQFDANRTYNTNQSNDLAYGIGNMFGSNNNNPGYFGGGSFSF